MRCLNTKGKDGKVTDIETVIFLPASRTHIFALGLTF